MATNIPGMTASSPREVTSIFPTVGNTRQETKMADMKAAGFSKGSDSPVVNADDYKGSSGDGGNKGGPAGGGGGVPDLGGSSGATFGGDARDSGNYD
jgi:hypothetical protein